MQNTSAFPPPPRLQLGLRTRAPPRALNAMPTYGTMFYRPQRLIVQKQCTEVSGTIVDATNGKQSDGVRHEADGDTTAGSRLTLNCRTSSTLGV